MRAAPIDKPAAESSYQASLCPPAADARLVSIGIRIRIQRRIGWIYVYIRLSQHHTRASPKRHELARVVTRQASRTRPRTAVPSSDSASMYIWFSGPSAASCAQRSACGHKFCVVEAGSLGPLRASRFSRNSALPPTGPHARTRTRTRHRSSSQVSQVSELQRSGGRVQLQTYEWNGAAASDEPESEP